MKREVLVFTLVGLLLLGTGYVLGRTEPIGKCTRKHQNFIEDGRIVVIPVGDVDGRKKYDVVISDENVKESMYPEEIAQSLNTGVWQYNEMLRLTEE